MESGFFFSFSAFRTHPGAILCLSVHVYEAHDPGEELAPSREFCTKIWMDDNKLVESTSRSFDNYVQCLFPGKSPGNRILFRLWSRNKQFRVINRVSDL